MNKIIKSIISIAMAFVLIFSVGCKQEEGDTNTPTIVPRPPVEKEITFKQTSLEMTVGNIFALEVDKYDRESSNPIEWHSEDETIAKVEIVQTGDVYTLANVVAVKEGTTNVVVTQGELTAKCAVTTSFYNKVAEVVVSVADEFNIQSNNGFNLNPKIKFDGNVYDDGEFTYSVADQTNFSIEDGVLTGLTNGASTEVTIEGTWRDKDSSDMRPLKKTLKVNVIDDVVLLVNELPADNAQVYTASNFAGKDYVNEIGFTPAVYVNGVLKTDADVDVSIEGTGVVFENNKIIGKESGNSVVTVTYTDNGKSLSKTFTIEVIRPEAHYANKIMYFSSYSGTLRDPADSYKEKTLGEYLYPGQNVEIIDAREGDAQLSVESGKVLGVKAGNESVVEKTILVGTKTSTYTVDVVVYGQYVYEAKDLDVFRRSVKNIAYDGYVELGRNIDASSYTAGLHFQGDPHSTSNYPTSTSYQEFTVPSYYGGTFDGKGYTISNLTVSYLSGLTNPTANEKGAIYGMFCALKGATIKNVGFMNTDVKGRTMLAFCSQNTTLENVRVDSKTLTKQYYYNANLLFYAAISGGSLKNVYITLPSTIEIKTGSGHTGYFAGALAPLPATAKIAGPTFENVVVISKLPLGVAARVTTSAMICYASNDTEAFKTKFNQDYWTRYGTTSMVSTIKSDWKAQADYDASITDYRMLERTNYKTQAPAGTYRFDTVSALKADTSIGSVLANFPADYWTVSNGELIWG